MPNNNLRKTFEERFDHLVDQFPDPPKSQLLTHREKIIEILLKVPLNTPSYDTKIYGRIYTRLKNVDGKTRLTLVDIAKQIHSSRLGADYTSGWATNADKYINLRHGRR